MNSTGSPLRSGPLKASTFKSAPGVPGPCPRCGDWVALEEHRYEGIRPHYRILCANPECYYRTRYVLKPSTAWRAHERNVCLELEEYYNARVKEIEVNRNAGH